MPFHRRKSIFKGLKMYFPPAQIDFQGLENAFPPAQVDFQGLGRAFPPVEMFDKRDI